MITKHIPNTITTLNLFSGCMGVWLAFQGNYTGATIAIVASAILDFLDGLAARLFHAYSAIGKELDSLADVVSFGVVPGAIVFSMLSSTTPDNWYRFIAFLIPMLSAIRLAKFNIDDRQTSSFIGLPTPANAIFWAGVSTAIPSWLIQHPYVLVALTILFALLLVCELPMFSLKFKNLRWVQNQWRYLFLAVCLLFIILFGWYAIAPIIIWYILLSVFIYLLPKNK